MGAWRALSGGWQVAFALHAGAGASWYDASALMRMPDLAAVSGSSSAGGGAGSTFHQSLLAYVGDGNNVANSLVLLAAVLGLRLRLATPSTHPLAARALAQARTLAKGSGAEIVVGEDPLDAVKDANFVYTDTWTSMGQEEEAAQRRKLFRPYQVNAELLSHSADAYVMHCLPAHRGEEVTAEVLDGPRSLVFDQAENRLHAQNAILERLLGR